MSSFNSPVLLLILVNVCDIKSFFLFFFKGKILSGEEDALEDDPERTEVTTGAFAGEISSVTQ